MFAAIDRALAPGGVFVTFGYLQSLVLPGAWALRRRLRRSFAEVDRSAVVWGERPARVRLYLPKVKLSLPAAGAWWASARYRVTRQ